ncbi:MAG TPA: hypothetical protein PLR60_03065 [Syntrophorhabdaceae bacterium]|nr:hypothetical protein [Syntrophorhabdaceae bacterium]
MKNIFTFWKNSKETALRLKCEQNTITLGLETLKLKIEQQIYEKRAKIIEETNKRISEKMQLIADKLVQEDKKDGTPHR